MKVDAHTIDCAQVNQQTFFPLLPCLVCHIIIWEELIQLVHSNHKQVVLAYQVGSFNFLRNHELMKGKRHLACPSSGMRKYCFVENILNNPSLVSFSERTLNFHQII